MVLDCDERATNHEVVGRWQDINERKLVGAMESRFLPPTHGYVVPAFFSQ
jgi:hypothetical protein